MVFQILSTFLARILIINISALTSSKKAMQRTTVNLARAAIKTRQPSSVPVITMRSACPIWGNTHIAGPSRPISSTSLRLKKKGGAAKPAKGTVRSQDDPSETDVDVDGILEKVRGKMKKATDWANSVTYDGVERGRGRVSPGKFQCPSCSSSVHTEMRLKMVFGLELADVVALLDGIKVSIPNQDSASTLPSLASVTVKQNILYIDCWDPSTTKHVESALHKANLPGLSPQKMDDRTIKIPVSL